jgi:hypothetical protein
MISSISNVVRKYLTVMLFTIAGLNTEAQTAVYESISINVSATVVSDDHVELTTLNGILLSGDFDKKKELYISPVSDPRAGMVLAKGRPGSQARLTYMIQEVLVEENGEGSIKLHYEISGGPSMVQLASISFLKGVAILNFSSDGFYYLWVGGHANMSKALPGKYIGQFSLEIVYI